MDYKPPDNGNNNLTYKKLLDIREASLLTGLCKTSIYAAIKNGAIVAKKYGARTLIPMSAIDDFIANLPTK